MRKFKKQKSWILQGIYNTHYTITHKPEVKDLPLAIKDKRVWRVWKMFCADTGVELPANDVDHLSPVKKAKILSGYLEWNSENKKRVYRVIASNYRGEQRDPEPVDLTRACDYCGNEYTPKRAGSRYCSTKCRVAGHRA